MNNLRLENNYSWLESGDEGLKHILWRALRVRAKNYFHNFRYKQKLWDGYDDFFKKDSGRFLTGLLPEVKGALKELGAPYTVADFRNKITWRVPSINQYFLNEGPNPVKELRDYQVDYVNHTIKYSRGLITSPTSSGKTNTMKAIVKALPPKTPTLILANKTSLVDQNYEEIKSLGLECGRLYGSKKDPNYITCSTSQSAHLLKPVLGKIQVLIVDEIHEMMSKVPKKIYAAMKNCSVRIGMSATPFKFGGKDESQMYDVKGWFGPPFLTDSTESGKLTTKELQDRNILSSAECYFAKVTEPKIPYAIYLDAVTFGIAENEHFHKQVSDLVKGLKGRSLVIVERIAHGDRLQELIPGSLWVRGEDTLETRKYIIDRLKHDEDDLVAIATSGIFNTGINVFCHNLVNACGGQADHQIIQRFGRGLRMANDKDHLKYYDFIFEINDYLEKHSWKRVKIIEAEGHKVTVQE
jgi:superfamily II DNA or RNA helicase